MEQIITTTELTSNSGSKVLFIALAVGAVSLISGYVAGSIFPLSNHDKDTNPIYSEPTVMVTPTQAVIVEADAPSYKLVVGAKSSITVPKGWKVTTFIAANRSLTDGEKSLALTETSKSGVLPIHEYSLIILASSKGSTITIREPYLLALGPIGFTPEEMPSGWVVVKAPEARGWGIAKHQEGAVTKFNKIYTCEVETMCGKYAHIPDSQAASLAFQGDVSELAIAEAMYAESFLNTDPFSFDQ